MWDEGNWFRTTGGGERISLIRVRDHPLGQGPRMATVTVKWTPIRSQQTAGGPGASGGCHRRIWLGDPARMQAMAKTLTADDMLPLVASLTPRERVRLLRLIALPLGAPVYLSVPPSRNEFSADEEPFAWDAEGWEDVG